MARNWAGNYEYRARRGPRPATFDELRALVREAPRLKVLGSRHSFTGIGDSDELVSLEHLPADLDLQDDRVSCKAASPTARWRRSSRTRRCTTSPRSRTSRSR